MIDCQISDIKILQSEIKVMKMSYEEADQVLKEDQALSKLNALAKSHKAFRNNNGAIKLDLPNVDVKLKNKKVDIQILTESASRKLVAEMMVIAGRVIAQYATEHKISMPFLTQEIGSFSEDIIQNKENLTAARKLFKPLVASSNQRLHQKLHYMLDLVCHVMFA